jgi:hypothetical protein
MEQNPDTCNHMFSRVASVILLVSFLMLLTHSEPASFPQSGEGSARQMLSQLQDHLSACNPQQEKRNENASLQKIEKLFTLAAPAPAAKLQRPRLLGAINVPDFPSLLVYTQTTSTYL